MLEIKVQHFLPFFFPPQSRSSSPLRWVATVCCTWRRLGAAGSGRWVDANTNLIGCLQRGGRTRAAPWSSDQVTCSSLSHRLLSSRCCWGRWTLAWAPPRWWWRSSRPAPACTNRCTSWRRRSLTGNSFWYWWRTFWIQARLVTFSLSHVVTLTRCAPPPLLFSTLQHHALLKCLAQCTEVTPYLLVMEFCPLVSFPFRHK